MYKFYDADSHFDIYPSTLEILQKLYTKLNEIKSETNNTQLQKELDCIIDIPIYFVSEKTIDKHYPKKKRYTLDQECLFVLLKKNFNPYRENNIKDIINECLREKKFKPVGLYLPNGSNNIPGNASSDRRIIFICPERIKNWAKHSFPKNSQSRQQIVFLKVFLHELGHSYLDSCIAPPSKIYYDDITGIILEESLANLFTIILSRELFRNDFKRIFKSIFFLIKEQPLEYKLALYLPLVRGLRLDLKLKFDNKFNIFSYFLEEGPWLYYSFWDRWYIYKKLFENIKKIEHQFTYKEFDYPYYVFDEVERYFYRYYRSFYDSLFDFFDFSILPLFKFNFNEGALFYLWKYRSSIRNIDFDSIAFYLLTCICSPTPINVIKILQKFRYRITK
jgi:hypothetical protein